MIPRLHVRPAGVPRYVNGRVIALGIIFSPVIVLGLQQLAWGFGLWIAGRVLRSDSLRRAGLQVMLSIDQLGNACLGGRADETISSRMGVAIREGRCVICGPICALLDRIDPGHCFKFIEADEQAEREVARL